jgi:hypothetical protein
MPQMHERQKVGSPGVLQAPRTTGHWTPAKSVGLRLQAAS